jgi:hypothetical protein
MRQDGKVPCILGRCGWDIRVIQDLLDSIFDSDDDCQPALNYEKGIMRLLGPFGVFRFLAAHLFIYLPLRFAMPITLRLGGLKQFAVGKCIILAPPEQMQTIMQGITYLQTIDREMFLRLTAEHRYIFWYHPKRFMECREIFSINDNYLQWGKEGVVACFLQAIMDFNLKHLPLERSVFKKQVAVVDRREIQQQVFEFVKKHSFPPELVAFYQEEAAPECPLDKG